LVDIKEHRVIVKKRSIPEMVKYAMGDGAATIIVNSMAAFALIYYTDALGLKPALAGLAISLSMLWDAISDPLMGHITDNTRSRYGRRYPYMVFGGFAMIISYYFLWRVPEFFRGSMIGLFGYLMMINIIMRTAFTVFVVPYSAMGYEICTDYGGRSRLQGIKAFMQMLPNLLSAFAWTIFFIDKENIRAVTIEKNYLNMALTFTMIGFAFIVAALIFTRKYIVDSRDFPMEGNSIGAFFKDFKTTILDRYSKWVFIFLFVVFLCPALMGTLQIYLYEHFMRFAPIQKTIAHGGGMFGAMIGALVVPLFTKKFDKRGSTCIACGIAVASNVILALLFLPGILKPGDSFIMLGITVPHAYIIFVFFHILFWFAINGVMFPMAASMMPDVSEIHQLQTGINKDGSYAAMFSFICKFAYGIGLSLSGMILAMIGYDRSSNVESLNDDVVMKMCVVALLIGPLLSLLSLIPLSRYPVNRTFLEKLRDEMSETKDAQKPKYS